MSNAPTPLIIGVPSKGRLQENTNAFFARAGLDLIQGRGARDYRGSIAGMPDVEVAYLSASDIISQLASGSIHFGISGEDLLREGVVDADSRVGLLAPLGFGFANVVVAVPSAWIDVTTMADVADVAALFVARHGRRLRVATKYIALTQRFFAQNHVSDYLIVESLGATEGAPAAGAAEIIVDITTTGATLAANALKIVSDGVMLRSQANLMVSRMAAWDAATKATARLILARIEAEELARTHKILRFMPAPTMRKTMIEVSAQMRARFGASFPFGVGPFAEGVVMSVLCPQTKLIELCDFIIKAGVETVVVEKVSSIFSAQIGLYERLEDFLATPS